MSVQLKYIILQNKHYRLLRNMRIVIFLLISIICSAVSFAQQQAVGLYMINGDTETAMTPIKYKNIKISGTFSKTARLEFADAKSQNRFTGTAKFKFVFGAVDAYHSMTHYMFAPMYSVNDFGIAQFEVKKDKRYLATVKIKPFGTSSTGVKESDRVKATTQELEKGVYIMEITAEPGEYCIIFNSMGTGGYSGTFDFGID